MRTSARLSFPRIITVFVLTLFVLQCSFSRAQEQPKAESDEGTISGTVTDQTQAVVTGAKVVLTSAAGEKRETETDNKGAYTFTGLKAGMYTVTVTAPNFGIKTFDNVNLPAGLELTLDAPLEPASEKTEVNVQSSSLEKVETESATVSGTITQKRLFRSDSTGATLLSSLRSHPV